MKSAPISNLTHIDNVRLDQFNDGKPVMVYSIDGANSGSTPNCVTRYVDGIGAVSEWAYCTDRAFEPCSKIEADGSLSQTYLGDSYSIEGMEPMLVNEKLSEDQQKLVQYITSNDVQITEPAFPDGSFSSSVANNSSDDTRNARQWLIWCVTDFDILPAAPYFDDVQGWCTTNFGPDAQAEVLAQIPTEPVLTINPAQGSTTAGESLEYTLTTNLYQQPITVSHSVGTLTICATDTTGATLTAGVLEVPGTDTTANTNVTLCLTSPNAATGLVTASASPAPLTSMVWAQPGSNTPDFECQVYATNTTTVDADPLVAEASATFTKALEGAAPVAPVITPAECTVDTPGETIWETVTQPENGNGITYSDVTIDDNHVATITATPETGYVLDADTLGDGWTINDDGTATWTYQLTSKTCDANGNNTNGDTNGSDTDGNSTNGNTDAGDTNGDNATGDNASGNASSTTGGNTNGKQLGLAATGAASPLLAGTAALLLVIAGAGAFALRRRAQR